MNSLRLMYSRLASHRCSNGHYVEPAMNVAAERETVFHGPAEKEHILYFNEKTGISGEMNFTYFNAVYTVENALSKVKDEKGMKRVEKFLKQGPCPDCGGTRLCERARAPRLRGISLDKACEKTLSELTAWVADGNKVEIHFNRRVTAEDLKNMRYNTLIVATGAKAKTFPLGDAVPVTTAKEALASGAKDVGQKVVVIGGGMVGCELALWLTKDLGKECTIVEGLEKLLAVNAPICSANSEMLERLVPFHGTRVLCKTTAVKTVDGGLVVKNLETNEEQTIPADTVILAVGFTPDDELYQAMQDAPEIYEIGDCRQFKNVHQAVWDAYEVANHI